MLAPQRGARLLRRHNGDDPQPVPRTARMPDSGPATTAQVGAEKMGLHGTIGALLFGAALSGLSQGVRDDIMPGMRSASEGLFVPLFFASAGLHFDLSFTSLPATTATALVLVPLAGKFAGAFVGTYVTRIDAPFALAAGLMSKGVAEIAFLLVLLESGTIEKDVFSLLVLIMFGYILFMPAVINFAVRRTVLPDRPALPDSVTPSFARYALGGWCFSEGFGLAGAVELHGCR